MWAWRTGRFSRVGGADRTFFPCGRGVPDVWAGTFFPYGRVEPGVFTVWAWRTGRFSRVGGRTGRFSRVGEADRTFFP